VWHSQRNSNQKCKFLITNLQCFEHVFKTGRVPLFSPERVQKPLASELLSFTGRWSERGFPACARGYRWKGKANKTRSNTHTSTSQILLLGITSSLSLWQLLDTRLLLICKQYCHGLHKANIESVAVNIACSHSVLFYTDHKTNVHWNEYDRIQTKGN
jgi:hypothetical protein